MSGNQTAGQEAYRLLQSGRYLTAIGRLRSSYRSWEETPVDTGRQIR